MQEGADFLDPEFDIVSHGNFEVLDIDRDEHLMVGLEGPPDDGMQGFDDMQMGMDDERVDYNFDPEQEII